MKMKSPIARTAFFYLPAAVIVLLPIASLGSASREEQTYSSKVLVEARHTAKDFSPDGDLSKEVWKKAKWIEFDHNPSGKSAYPGAATRVAVAWTENSIYVAFSCKYDSLNVYEGEDIQKERWELWLRDVAEVFLNPQPDNISHYYEFEVAPNNQWIDLEIEKKKDPFNDASWNSGFEHATRIDPGRHVWTAELRIPLSSMKVASIQPGAIWRVNFFRAAGKGGDQQRMFLAWSSIPQGQTFHVPSRFGILRFSK
jgi:hypothetical protein